MVGLLDGAPAGAKVRIDAGEATPAIVRALLPSARAGRLSLAAAFDPLATLATRGGLSAAYDEVSGSVADLAPALDEAGMDGTAIVADGRPWSDGGASEAQELAAVLAAYVAHLRLFEARGYPLAEASRRIGVTLAAGDDQFVTIAKFRAARLLTARVLASIRVGEFRPHVHAETAWRMATRRDPHTNILRATVAAFAAAVGGADSMTVLPFDGVPGPAGPFGRRLARNTQLVLIEEANLHRVADPGAGAGAVEALTEELAEAAWESFRVIEGAGGLLAAIRSGTIQRDIAAMREARLNEVMTRERVLTGTSAFPRFDPDAATR